MADTEAREVSLEESGIDLGASKADSDGGFGGLERPSRLLNPARPDDAEVESVINPDAARPSTETEETETETEETEETAPRSRIEILSDRLRASKKPDESAETTLQNERVERARYEGSTEARIAALEKGLTTPPEEDEPSTGDDPDIDYDSRALGRALRESFDSDDPADFSRAVGSLTRHEAKKVAGEEVASLREKVDAQDAAAQAQAANDKLQGSIRNGIGAAETTGGLEADIVKDYRENGEGSLLYEYFVKFPLSYANAEGVQNAVFAIARMVDKADDAGYFDTAETEETTEPDAVTADTTIGSTGTRSTGANRSVKRESGKSQKPTLSREDQIRESIVSVRPRSDNLPEAFRSG